MKYDLSQLKERIAERKRIFKLRLFFCVGLFITSVLIIAFNYGKNDTVVLAGGMAAIILIFVFADILKKYSPAVLFSPEIRGVNIKEDEYVLRTPQRGYKMGKYLRYVTPSTGSNMQTKVHEKMRAGVYLRLDDGNIYAIDNLFTAHTNLYEIGDVLYKPAGVKYPIIESRITDRQPCPLCGQLNDDKSTECGGCGLNIFK